jgi:hypothetical protein
VTCEMSEVLRARTWNIVTSFAFDHIEGILCDVMGPGRRRGCMWRNVSA